MIFLKNMGKIYIRFVEKLKKMCISPCTMLRRDLISKRFDIPIHCKTMSKMDVGSKIKFFKKESIFNFLIALLLAAMILPAPLVDPEDVFNQTSGQYQAINTSHSLYSTVRKHGISRDYDDQFFSDSFLLDRFQLLSFKFILLFCEQFVISKLLSYNLISLPPPFLT